MIDSYTATYVIIGFLIIFGILIPILDKIPKIKNFVSFRWTLVIVYSALCIGVIIDFEHLDNSVRFAVVIGGIILAGLFVLVRSIEKAFINNWHLPRTRASISKGDIQADISVNPKTRVPIFENAEHNNNKEKRSDKATKILSEYITSKENSDDYDEVMNECVLFTHDSDNENNN